MISVRFPRFVRERPDKSVQDATSVQQVRSVQRCAVSSAADLRVVVGGVFALQLLSLYESQHASVAPKLGPSRPAKRRSSADTTASADPAGVAATRAGRKKKDTGEQTSTR